MRCFALLVLLLGAVWTQTSAVCTGRVGNEVYVGDLTPIDYVFQSTNGAGQVSLPAAQIGGAYLNFDIDVFGDSNLGCLFSFQSVGQSQAAQLLMEAYVTGGKVVFTASQTTVESFNIWSPNQWNRVTFSYDQALATVVIYVNGAEVARRAGFPNIPVATRKGTVGFCPSRTDAVKGLNGRVDNFIITTTPKTTFDIAFQQSQFFPIIPANGLIAYYDFNSWTGANSVPAKVGTAAVPGNLDANIIGTATRPARGTSAQTNRQCAFAGGVSVDDAGMVTSPYFGVIGGGYTQTFECTELGAQRFVFGQKWNEKTGLQEVAVFASVDHRFRLSVSPSGLQVLHQNWGGWERIGVTTEYVEDDLLTLQITEKEFKLQVGGYGWIRVYERQGVLAYEYAIISNKCGNVATCLYDNSDVTEYSFLITPLPEPMGPGATGAGGLGGLPDVLACPNPGDPCPGWHCGGTGIYNPGAYCPSHPEDSRCCAIEGYRSRPVCKTQYPEDYCRSATSDSFCCTYYPERAICLDAAPELYCKTPTGRANDACCTKSGFGCQDMCWNNYPQIFCPCASSKVRADRDRCCPWTPAEPWCVAIQPPSPPPPPPSPVVDPPFVPTNPCANLQATDINAYNAIVGACNQIWGATPSNSRSQCIAVSCTIGDEVAPKPDCRTAEMLFQANPSYVRPAECVSGCPNGCSFRGSCNSATRTCTCNNGWSGADCSLPATYSCWTLTNAATTVSVEPVAEIYRHSTAVGRTKQLTPNFNDYTAKELNSNYAVRVADAVTIVPVSTLSDWTNQVKDYHLWITGGDSRTNSLGGGSATITITRQGGAALLANQLPTGANLVGVASGTGAYARCGGVASSESYANSISCEIGWTQGSQASLTIIGLVADSTFDVKVVANSEETPVLVAGASRQNEKVVEIVRLVADSQADATTRRTFSASFRNKNCANNLCNVADCQSCTQRAACGWCVEMNSCMPGNVAGPEVGTCLNWRKTFNPAITRRLTQIPGFPSNPSTTDVFTSTTDGNVLPIDLSVVIQPHSQVPWDLVILTTFQDNNLQQWKTALENLRSELGAGYPNLAMSVGAIVEPAWSASAYRMLIPGTNTNANNLMEWVVAKCGAQCNYGASAPAALHIKRALFSFGDPNNNDFQLRLGTGSRRLISVVTTAGISSADTTDIQLVRARLLNKNAVPVFVVPATLFTEYKALVAQLGFGAVIPLDASWSTSNMRGSVVESIKRASYQVSLTHMITGQTVVDTAAFSARQISYTVNGLRPDERNGFDFRFRAIVPVRNQASATPGDAQLYVPGFASAVVEHVPTDLPTFKGAVATYDVMEGDANGVVVLLPGESFRNLYKVVARVRSVTAKGGEWRKLFDGVRNGAPFYGAGDTFNPNGAVIPEGGLVFVPPTGFTSSVEGVTFGDAFATITYDLFDFCGNSSNSFTVTINVKDNNFPPYANAIPAHGPEYTPIIVNLDGSDIDGDSLEYFIAGPVKDSSVAQTANAGKLYQYYDNFDARNPDASKEITGNDVKVTSGTRVIYMPPRFKHSFADPETNVDRLLIPCVSYYVKESNTAAKLRSLTVDVPITIDHVNNAPWVWNDADRAADQTLAAVERTWAFPESFPAQAQGVSCWAGMNAPVCVWEEDFGEEFWWMTGFRYIHMGGYDIDGGKLDIEISSLDCFPGTSVMVHLAGSENIEVGTVIRKQDNGLLIPALRFRPVKETHNGNFVGRDYYCRIGYRVRDDQDAISLNEGSVTVSITDVNKQPRLESFENEFTAYEEVPYAFTLEVDDPEMDAFTTTLVGCEQPRGVFQFCLDSFCNNVQTVDCTANAPVVIQPTAESKYPMGLFTSGRLENPSDGIGYNVLTFTFQDSVSKFPARPFKVTFNVIRLNTPPVITVDGEVADQHLRSTDFDATFAAQFDVADKDIDQGFVTVTVSLDNSRADSAVLDTTYAEQFVAIDKKADGSAFTFMAELAEAKKAIAVISVTSPVFDAQKYPDGTATAVLRVTANDNGNSGQCPTDTYLRLSNCPLETTTAVVISWVKPADNRAAVIGGSAAAAGFGVLAVAAAAVAFKRLQAKGSNDNYQPWSDDAEGEDTVVNPLYQGTGNSGTNALYDASDAFNPASGHIQNSGL